MSSRRGLPPDGDAGREDILSQTSVEQQVGLLVGAGFWSARGEPAAGLRPIVFSDGPVGVRGTRWDERDPSVCLPAPIAVAASWDEEMASRLGGLLAAEARGKGVDVVLAPSVNLQRSPLAGRHFECLSEDPLLSGRIGTAYVRGLQAGGVGATAKHFVANDSEGKRFTVDVRVDERSLREIYLAPFEQLVTVGGVWVVMPAYNSVNGATMTENALLADPLLGEWGFDGVVVSDWYATRSPNAVQAGVGLVMPGPADQWRDAVLAGVREGSISPEAVADGARRLLRLGARVGALTAAAPTDVPASRPVRGQLREAAAAGMVLLHDAGGVLPLDRRVLGRLAVLGPRAGHGAAMRGGGSSGVVAPYLVSPLAGVTAALGGRAQVVHAEGVDDDRLAPVPSTLVTCPRCGESGFAVRYLAGSGEEIRAEHRTLGHLVWYGEDIIHGATVEVSALLRADVTGEWGIGVAVVGQVSLMLDGETVIDEVVPDPDNFAASFLDPPQRSVARELTEGSTVAVELVHQLDPPEGFAALTFGLRRPRPERERAVELARGADACVVVVGTGPQVETEARDRVTLALPDGQDDLVHAIAAVNPRTVVVVNAGAPVLMPWRDEVAAVLVAWFPGQEFGSALADVLFGLAEPGGRLPCTWPAREQDVPVLSTQPVDGVLHYAEGLHVGHRGWLWSGVEPAYPFGHGLGFTSWTYLGIDAQTCSAGATVEVRVRNTGHREGKEVVQVYLSRPESEVERPVRWLAGFAVVRAAPGDEVVAGVSLARRAFEHWSAQDGRWATEPGAFLVHAGRSVGDLRLATAVTAWR
jgi:beta-glucosidase